MMPSLIKVLVICIFIWMYSVDAGGGRSSRRRGREDSSRDSSESRTESTESDSSDKTGNYTHTFIPEEKQPTNPK